MVSRWIVLIASVVAAFGVGCQTASAQADPGQDLRSGSDPDWTAERMRRARALPLPARTKGKVEQKRPPTEPGIVVPGYRPPIDPIPAAPGPLLPVVAPHGAAPSGAAPFGAAIPQTAKRRSSRRAQESSDPRTTRSPSWNGRTFQEA